MDFGCTTDTVSHDGDLGCTLFRDVLRTDEKHTFPNRFGGTTSPASGMKTMSVHPDNRTKSFAEILEEEWNEQSEELEERHFDAAFDAKVAEIDSTTSTTGIIHDHHHHHPDVTSPTTIKKSNCYSPYVPSSALRIQAMMEFVQFRPGDIFCDIGCGDGRVCVAVAHHVVHNHHSDDDDDDDDDDNDRCCFRAIGIDVSPDCIGMAQEHLIVMNQQLVVSDDVKKCIQFHQADLTIPPDELLSGELSPF